MQLSYSRLGGRVLLSKSFLKLLDADPLRLANLDSVLLQVALRPFGSQDLGGDLRFLLIGKLLGPHRSFLLLASELEGQQRQHQPNREVSDVGDEYTEAGAPQ
jgi:hypothetical protein